MYYIKKSIEVSAAHELTLGYPSKCSSLHGHNWLITVECRARTLNADGMVADFSMLKKMVADMLDHRVLNDVVDFNPTAENIARWIVDSIPTCFRCEVQESRGNIAVYEED